MCRRLLVAIACLAIVSCNAETFGYVKKAIYDILQKRLDNAEAELNAARQRESGCLHKYQFYNEGVRTWQLDLVTGERCIVLTTEADLKKPETKMQVCK